MCTGSSDDEAASAEGSFTTPPTRPRFSGVICDCLPDMSLSPETPTTPCILNTSDFDLGKEQSPGTMQTDIVEDYFAKHLGRASEANTTPYDDALPEESPTHSGFLEKKGDGLIKFYRRRWCEIHGESLYYSTMPGEEILGRIPLVGTTVLVMQDKERPFTFELSGRDLPRTYILAAGCEEERNAWVRAITRTIKWCEVESAEVMEDWLEALLPETTSLSLKDFRMGGVIGRGSFGKVVEVDLMVDKPPAPTPERKRWLRENLVVFYRKYRPERLRGVDTIIKHSTPGHESNLYSRLLERYPMAHEDLAWLLSPPKYVLAAANRARELVEKEKRRIKSGNVVTKYAMKVVKKSALPSIKTAKMMMAEKAILQSMNHPYIVKLNYAFQTTSKLYLVMTYLGGGDLRTHLSRDKRFSEVRARFYAAQILLALDHMHTHGIVYRDLKPQNVVLDTDGHAVLTDLGLASDITESGRAYTFCGTPQYLAPEVLQGSGYKKAVDFWALGVVTYEMLVGATPFHAGDSMHEMFLRIMDESVKYPALVSRPARDFVSQLLEREPAKRLCSASIAKATKFFKPISWSELRGRRMRAPYCPPPDLCKETGNRPPTDVDAIPTLLKPDLNAEFAGFSYLGAEGFKRRFVKGGGGGGGGGGCDADGSGGAQVSPSPFRDASADDSLENALEYNAAVLFGDFKKSPSALDFTKEENEKDLSGIFASLHEQEVYGGES